MTSEPMTVDRDYLLARTEQEPNTGCWLWTGGVSVDGYARLYVPMVRRQVRLARLLLNITDHPDKFARHRCDTPECVNPDHLVSGSPADNTWDSVRRGRHARARATTCSNGHPYDDTNTVHTKRGDRQCRTCRRLTNARMRERLRSRKRIPK